MRNVTILILYFSGAGATKYVAEQMNAYLSRCCDIDLLAIEHADGTNLEPYDAIIIGAPVHHAAPAARALDYFNSIRPLRKPKPAFLFNTRGLYSCNTNRILSKQTAAKNIVTVMDTAYRGPASDGSLIAPFVHRFFEFQPDIDSKIQKDCGRFFQLLEQGNFRSYTPRFHISSIFNAPNKLAGQLITFRIHLYKERCTLCGKCIKNCPHRAVQTDSDGYPLILLGRCKNCYRCIHHCPGMALSLSKRRTPKKLPYMHSDISRTDKVDRP